MLLLFMFCAGKRWDFSRAGLGQIQVLEGSALLKKESQRETGQVDYWSSCELV